MEFIVVCQLLIVNCGFGDGFGLLWFKVVCVIFSYLVLCFEGLFLLWLNVNCVIGELDILIECFVLVWVGDCDVLGNLMFLDCGLVYLLEFVYLLVGYDGWLDSYGLM